MRASATSGGILPATSMDDEGNRFGYQLTFFRISLSPLETERTSAWGTNQIYMAHFTVSDVENKEFYCFEKFNRDALGLAGFTEDPFKMNVGDWYMLGTGRGRLPLAVIRFQGRHNAVAGCNACEGYRFRG